MRCRASLPLCFIFQSLLLFSQKTPKLLMFLLLPSLLLRPTDRPNPRGQLHKRTEDPPLPPPSSCSPPPGSLPRRRRREEAVTRHKPGEILCQRDENLGPKVVEPGPHHFPGHMCSLKSVEGGGSLLLLLSPQVSSFRRKKTEGRKNRRGVSKKLLFHLLTAPLLSSSCDDAAALNILLRQTWKWGNSTSFPSC